MLGFRGVTTSPQERVIGEGEVVRIKGGGPQMYSQKNY